jgi:hypothetical protein
MNMQLNDRLTNLSVDPDFFDLITNSFCRLVGKPLAVEGQGPDWLYSDAPFPVLAHNTEPDPRFIYANKTAQACFEYTWDEFISLPSRLSAEAPNRAERQRLMEAVALKGFISDYSGLRISKSGRRFSIENGIVWQLIDRNGHSHGQAATFSSWKTPEVSRVP